MQNEGFVCEEKNMKMLQILEPYELRISSGTTKENVTTEVTTPNTLVAVQHLCQLKYSSFGITTEVGETVRMFERQSPLFETELLPSSQEQQHLKDQ